MFALAIDVGIIAAAKSHCQNAADAGAAAGARALNGLTASNNNYGGARSQAAAAAVRNEILGKTVSTADVDVTIGKYIYNSAQARFVAYPIEPGSTNDARYNWSLADVAVTHRGTASFARMFGVGGFSTRAEATAVHRPRDVALVLDFSGSMRFGSLLGIPIGTGSTVRRSNNPEDVYPWFGHYSAPDGPGFLKQNDETETLAGSTYRAGNLVASHPLNSNRPPILEDFYNGPNAGAGPAFSRAGNGDGDRIVSGDRPLKTKLDGILGGSGGYARDVEEVFQGSGSLEDFAKSSFEANGYDAFVLYSRGPFQGYTQGPGAWGKTFFIWPPDPRGATSSDQRNNGAKDWRARFFLKADNSPVDDNRLLWGDSGSSTGNWRSPRYNGNTFYKINYRAILEWIRNSGPNPFPNQLWSGRICYYDAIPNPSDSSINSRWWNFDPLNPSGLSDNERFWKDYIDFVLGLSQAQSPNQSYPWYLQDFDRPSVVNYTGYGPDFEWGKPQISEKPDGKKDKDKGKDKGKKDDDPPEYMDYKDKPLRPRSHFWFGPMTMLDFIGCYNLAGLTGYRRYDWMSGTAHEAPLYACKLAIQAALKDIENNHPNDQVTLIFYSGPKESSSDINGRFNAARVPMSKNYGQMTDSLWFPPSTVNGGASSVRPFDADNAEVPRASGSTCYSMGLMLAYNQFSGNPSLVNYDPAVQGGAGGLGRHGAQKIVIFETDGQPNTLASASGFVSSVTGDGANHSYYKVRYKTKSPGSSEFPSVSGSSDNSTAVRNQIYDIAGRICADTRASKPGFSTPRKPAKIHCIAFGPLFERGGATEALQTLGQMEVIGGVQKPGGSPGPGRLQNRHRR